MLLPGQCRMSSAAKPCTIIRLLKPPQHHEYLLQMFPNCLRLQILKVCNSLIENCPSFRDPRKKIWIGTNSTNLLKEITMQTEEGIGSFKSLFKKKKTSAPTLAIFSSNLPEPIAVSGEISGHNRSRSQYCFQIQPVTSKC